MEPLGYSKERTAKILEKYDLDLLIATSPVNVSYTSGLPLYQSAENPILLSLNNMYPHITLIRRGHEGDGALIHWVLYRSVPRFSWLKDAVGIKSQREAQTALAAKLKEWGFAGKKAGVESTAPKFVLDVLNDPALKVQVCDGDKAFLDMRVIKTDAEVALIEKATLITEQAIDKTIAALHEGITDFEMIEIAKKAFLEYGAGGWDHVTMNIGDSDPEAPGIGRAVKKGEIIRLDFGAVYKGYVADVNKHVVIGEAPPKAKQLVDDLIDLQHYIEVRVKPGVNMRCLSDEALAYYKESVTDNFFFQLGQSDKVDLKELSLESVNLYNHVITENLAFSVAHSIGMQCEEQHLFGVFESLDEPFEKNMVFEIEAWAIYEGALVGVEDCYVVTDSGCRKMTTQPKTILSI
ncbi:MAG: M24 family metallopeptidase [Treponema sp.]|jgi:Xaa-Pro aminopeptidase|nr:M24 family metallopeptidase [Treponema sp.]